MTFVVSYSTIVTAEFIINSTAKGCFLVLRSEDRSPDEFRAFLRSQPNSPLTGLIDDLLPSVYSILVYDLEESGLPNGNPAYEQHNKITVERTGI